jgi:hypothetical protein
MARLSWLAVIIFGVCIPRLSSADEPVASPPATPGQIEQTIDRSIGYLESECADWLAQRKCAACHHVGMPLWALSEARRQGYAIDETFLAETIESLLGSDDKLLATKIFPDPSATPDPRPSGQGLNMGLPFLAVAAQSLPALKEGEKQSLKLVADEIVKKQQPDGSWEFFAGLRRPPINESQASDVAWIIMALQGEPKDDASEPHRQSLEKAVAWLEHAKLPDHLQAKALKLLVAIRTGKSSDAQQPAIDELLSLQRPDGGWGQLPEMPSDAFATGQVLYILSLTGLTAERPEIRRAVHFLIATQAPDGSWPMTSRSTPNGEPGSAKLLTPITCAATSWATLGLTRIAPK